MMSDKSPIKKTGSLSGSFLRTGCSVLLVAISSLSFSQARLVINNDGYIVINNSAYLVIDNSNANAITELNAGGRIISESETNRVRWNISNATGTYTVPFYEDGEAAEIPVTATVTNPGTAGAANRIDFSTYDGPTFDNVLYMPAGVTNMSNLPVVNNSPKVIDRFWVLDANHTVKPDVTLSFGYVDAEWSAVGNTITEATLEAEYWDNPGSNWTAVPSGTINTGTNVVSSVNATASTFFKYWTLVDAACVTPTVSNAGSNQSVCGTTATLAGNTATAGIGEWTLVSGTGTITNPSSPNSGVTGLGMGPNVFQWTISNPFCTASSSQVTITVIAPPTTSSAGSNQTICGATATLAGNTPATGTGTWTLVSGTGTITTPSSPSSGVTGLGVGANVFQWTIANSPCTASSSTVTITVVDAPTTSNAGTNQSVCGATAALAGNTPTSGTGTWTLVSGAGTITAPSSPSSGVTGLGAGANVFQWTIVNSPCTASSSTVTITVVDAPTTSNAGTNQSVCGTTATLAGNSPTTGTGTWTLVSGAGAITAPSSPSSGVTGLGAGANVFQWTIANSPCTASSSTVTITVVDAPTTSNAGADQNLCSTSATFAGNNPTSGTGTWTLVSGAGTITTPSSPTSTVIGLALGANVFQWTVSNPPCAPSSSTVTITNTGGATTSNAGANQSICGTTATLAGNTPTTGTGTWTLVSGTGTITTPSSPSSGVTGLGTGANVFQWTIANPPCASSSSTVTVTVVDAPTTSVAGTNQSVCGTTATLAGNIPSSGNGTWTLVSGAGTITTPSSPSSGVTGLGAGANVFQWTIANSPCTASSSTVTVTVVDAPTISVAGTNQSVCGTTVTLAGNTPTSGTGTWTLVSGAGTITTPSFPSSGVTGLGSGANVFQWRIANSPCTASSSTVTVTVVDVPTASNAGTNQTICGATATLAGNTPSSGTGTWTLVSGAGTITTPSSPSSGVTGLGAGANVFQWTIANSPCTASSSTVTVTVIDAPTASNAGSNQTVCGTTATFAGNTPSSGTGTWTLISGAGTITTPSSPSSGVTGLGAGANVFQWTISNSPCAVSSSTVTITGVAFPVAAASGNSPACEGSAINLTSSGGTTYSWTGPNGYTSSVQNPTITGATPSAAGTYTVTVTASGCSATSTVSVAVTNAPVAAAGGAGFVCVGSSLNLTASGGTGYSWSGPNGFTSSTQNPSISGVTLAGSGTYTVTVTASSGCTATSAVAVSVLNAPTAAITGSSTVCQGSAVTLTASGGGTYSWSNGSTAASVSVNPSTPTLYWVIVSVGSCTDSAGINITIDPVPTITAAGNGPVCDGAALNLTASGGSAYSWTGPNGYTSSAQNPTITPASPAASGTYTVTVTGSNSCTAASTVTVTVNPLPTISISGTTTICSGNAATLTASGASTYSWNTGATSSTVSVSPTSDSTYTVTGTDANGCTSTQANTVNVTTPPVASVTGNSPICEGQSLTLTAGGSGPYLWSNGQTTQSITVNPVTTTPYSLIVGTGCTDTATVSVTVNPLPTLTTSGDTTIIKGTSATLIAGGGTTYTWTPSTGLSCDTCAMPVATPTVTTTYCVETSNSNGCVKNECLTVEVDILCGELFVPKAFSPNGDGENEVEYVMGNCINDLEFAIFDRWGEKVFETTDITIGWDGTYQGKKLDAAVFVYYLKATVKGVEVNLHGNITLVK